MGSVTSGVSSPNVALDCRTRFLAATLGTYLSVSAIWRTRCCVASLICGSPLSARLTVATDTDAR